MERQTNTKPGVIMSLYEIWRDRLNITLLNNEDEVGRAAFFAGYMAGSAGTELREKVLQFYHDQKIR